MEPRKKPIPAPLERSTHVRELQASSRKSALPTIAALLASASLATCLVACHGEPRTIAPDTFTLSAAVANVAKPGTGAIEQEPELTPADVPIAAPTTKPVIAKPVPVPTAHPRTAGVRPPIKPMRPTI
jgi:hypothetical protein